MRDFAELTTIDNQKLYVRKELVAAMEVVTASARVEGHIKLYTAGFKFLIQGEIDEVLRKLSEPEK